MTQLTTFDDLFKNAFGFLLEGSAYDFLTLIYCEGRPRHLGLQHVFNARVNRVATARGGVVWRTDLLHVLELVRFAADEPAIVL